MGGHDPGVWKLIVYPLALLLIVGFILNLTIGPFVDNNIPVENTITPTGESIKSFVDEGIVANVTILAINATSTFSFLPNLYFQGINLGTVHGVNPFDIVGQSGKDFIKQQVDIFYYFPSSLQLPLFIFILVCLLLGLVGVIGWLIP